ncbi:MAG TPA: hypothetical protein PLV88_01005 [Methanoregulaceae archaeon]|mgnify:FL=1|jgi:hypothetical protein|nr:hypothetical protein [Methanomicrobiales archaeon]HNB02843.1 hypothetical protein [Methanoregulaceae archaeon]HNO07899.1 hypothetical protein [Methanoregulaceae archaeon]HPS23185.1 hypothetical protein [Methanoregulaceae archaeon]
MKKLVFGALIALLALLVLPGAVSAGPSDTITVTGSIGGSIDVTVTADVNFGAMTPGNTYTDTNTDLSVTSTFASWTVSATDQNAGENTGKMLSGTTPLANAFKINVNAGAFQPLPYSPILSGSAGSSTADVGFQQQVVSGDQAGSYTITVVFTGATA